jgi:hypothetical protein
MNNNGNPSPPASIARSSYGTGLYVNTSNDNMHVRKPSMMEESLYEHYKVLKGYLSATFGPNGFANKPNRARDKLLRLSVIQFQELSTDVYDELLRREEDRRKGGDTNPANDTPRFLLPKKSFHPKRNQARQKLSTLPIERFRLLASDVFYELERRIPRFVGGDINRTASPALSTTSSRGNQPQGYRGATSPSPGPFLNNPSNGPIGPPFAGSGHGPRGNSFGRPLPKVSQSNTIIPNKGTMVEDDDETGDDDDDMEDAFGLEKAAMRQSKRNTTKSMATEVSFSALFRNIWIDIRLAAK